MATYRLTLTGYTGVQGDPDHEDYEQAPTTLTLEVEADNYAGAQVAFAALFAGATVTTAINFD